jgi:hypothetical protein
MKRDYSQPGLMPGRYLEQIDLPSAYLVYAVGSRLRQKRQLSPGGASSPHLCQSDAVWDRKIQIFIQDSFSARIRACTSRALLFLAIKSAF